MDKAKTITLVKSWFEKDLKYTSSKTIIGDKAEKILSAISAIETEETTEYFKINTACQQYKLFLFEDVKIVEHIVILAEATYKRGNWRRSNNKSIIKLLEENLETVEAEHALMPESDEDLLRAICV